MAEEPNYALVRERLKKTRQQRDISLRQVEDETRVGAATLSRIERGTTTPDLATLDKLIVWLDLKRSDVFNAAPMTTNSTPEAVTALLRADPKLDGKTVEALGAIFEAAYDQFAESETKTTR